MEEIETESGQQVNEVGLVALTNWQKFIASSPAPWSCVCGQECWTIIWLFVVVTCPACGRKAIDV